MDSANVSEVNDFSPDDDVTLDWHDRTVKFPPQMTACFTAVLNGEYKVPALPDAPEVKRVLDLGAACGGFALWAIDRWPGCKVTCVEPDPDLRRYLRSNVPEADVWPYAVVEASAHEIGHTVMLFLGPDGHRGFNSIAPVTVGYRWHAKSIVVPAMDPRGLPPCDVLKIDAEGVELSVLQLYPYLASVWCVIFEWHAEFLRRPCEEALEAAGFHCVSARTQDPDMGEQTWCRTRARVCRRGEWKWMMPEQMGEVT